MNAQKMLAVAEFDGDAARLGQGAHDIGPLLPNGSIITGLWIRVLTAVTGGSGFTISLGVGSATDIQTAVGTATWGSTGLKTPSGSVPNLLAASARPKMTVGVADLLTGRFRAYIEYIPPTDNVDGAFAVEP